MKRLTHLLRTVIFSSVLALLGLPGLAAELVMVEEPGCAWCDKWNRELSDIYPKTPEGKFAPLRRINLREARSGGAPLGRPVSFTPTFVLVENGQEVGRIEGYPGEDFFWGLLDMMLTKSTAFAGGQG